MRCNLSGLGMAVAYLRLSVVAITPEHYWDRDTSLLDAQPQLQWRRYEKGAALIAQHGQLDAVRRVAAFSQGFYRMRVEDGRLLLTDLRMDQEPGYVFRFDLGPQDAPGLATRDGYAVTNVTLLSHFCHPYQTLALYATRLLKYANRSHVALPYSNQQYGLQTTSM